MAGSEPVKIIEPNREAFPRKPGVDEGSDDLRAAFMKVVEDMQHIQLSREMKLREEIRSLGDRIRELESGGNQEKSHKSERFGPFGIFNEDADDGTYRLSLPLLIAMSGAIFGMLLSML